MPSQITLTTLIIIRMITVNNIITTKHSFYYIILEKRKWSDVNSLPSNLNLYAETELQTNKMYKFIFIQYKKKRREEKPWRNWQLETRVKT
jgi:hypothetical protein